MAAGPHRVWRRWCAPPEPKRPRAQTPPRRRARAKQNSIGFAGGLCAFGANRGRVFAWLQAAGGAAVGLAAGSVAHASEEEHGLAPANYPWSHEGPMSTFDATGCANAPAPNAAKPPSHARPSRFWRGCAKRAVQGRRHPQTRGPPGSGGPHNYVKPAVADFLPFVAQDSARVPGVPRRLRHLPQP